MKLTVNEAIVLNEVLKEVIDDNEMKVDALLKFKLLGIAKEIEPLAANYELVYEDKIREYGTEKEEGTISISYGDENFDKFQEDLVTLLQSEIEIKADKLSPADVFDRGIKAEYLIKLHSIIEA